MLEDLGYADVATYLQSGNALVTAEAESREGVEGEIAAGILDRFGMSVAVIARTSTELAAVVAGNPLGAEPENPGRFFVAFLSAVPDGEALLELDEWSFGDDSVWVRGAEAYLWCPDGASAMTSAEVIGKTLGVVLTTRNWNTVTKLALLAADPPA